MLRMSVERAGATHLCDVSEQEQVCGLDMFACESVAGSAQHDAILASTVRLELRPA